MSERLFEIYAVVGVRPDEPGTPYLEMSYPPPESADPALVKNLPQFCFPDGKRVLELGAPFAFTLTDSSGARIYGFCHQLREGEGTPGAAPGQLHALCLVTRNPWFATFFQILRLLKRRVLRAADSMGAFVVALAGAPLPSPGQSFNVAVPPAAGVPGEELTFQRPILREESTDMPVSQLLTTLGVDTLVSVFASLLHERRVVLVDTSFSTVTATAHALLRLLYPFSWLHIFVPVMSRELLKFCCAPMPFLVGMPDSMLPELATMPTEEVMVVTVTGGRIANDLGDSARLPNQSRSELLSKLRRIAAKPSPTAEQEVLSAFLEFFVSIFGMFRSCLFKDERSGRIQFDMDALNKLHQKTKSAQQFVDTFSHSQMMEQWKRALEARYADPRRLAAPDPSSTDVDLTDFERACLTDTPGPKRSSFGDKLKSVAASDTISKIGGGVKGLLARGGQAMKAAAQFVEGKQSKDKEPSDSSDEGPGDALGPISIDDAPVARVRRRRLSNASLAEMHAYFDPEGKAAPPLALNTAVAALQAEPVSRASTPDAPSPASSTPAIAAVRAPAMATSSPLLALDAFAPTPAPPPTPVPTPAPAPAPALGRSPAPTRSLPPMPAPPAAAPAPGHGSGAPVAGVAPRRGGSEEDFFASIRAATPAPAPPMGAVLPTAHMTPLLPAGGAAAAPASSADPFADLLRGIGSGGAPRGGAGADGAFQGKGSVSTPTIPMVGGGPAAAHHAPALGPWGQHQFPKKDSGVSPLQEFMPSMQGHR